MRWFFVFKLVKASLNGNEDANDGDTHATVQNKGAVPKKRPRNTETNRTTEGRGSGGGRRRRRLAAGTGGDGGYVHADLWTSPSGLLLP